jgi:hypothetical protein
VRVADAASYALLAALLLTVVLRGRALWRVPAMRAILVFLAAAIPLYGLIYYGNVRYRIPLEPFMILVVAAWVPVIGRALTASRTRNTAISRIYGEGRKA